MARPRYRALAKLFMAPDIILQGSIFEWDGTPSPHMEPLNEEARTAIGKYFADNPQAGTDPFAGLPTTIDPKDALNRGGVTVIEGPPKATGIEQPLVRTS